MELNEELAELENTIVFENQEVDGETFKIDNAQKADWAIERIKLAQESLDIYTEVAKSKIAKLKSDIEYQEKKVERETGFLKALLGDYIETVPAKETKTQKSFELPSGKIIKKKASVKFTYNDDELLCYLLKTDTSYVKNVQSVDWGNYKKLLSETEGVVINKETGEIVDAVTVEQVFGRLEVK